MFLYQKSYGDISYFLLTINIFFLISRVKPRKRKPRFRRRSAKSRDQRTTTRTRSNKSAKCPHLKSAKILRNKFMITCRKNALFSKLMRPFIEEVKQRLLITFVPSETLPVWLKVIVFAETISRILCAFTSALLLHVKIVHFLYNRLVRTINSFIYPICKIKKNVNHD